ncbi:transposase [Streptomyces netropsis]|uniref:transposase n=1 Tax=Streptomyces netropsis TaxID=55404 RepID=UPI0037ADF329
MARNYKARVEHRTVSQAVVTGTGIIEDGGREVLGLIAGDSETKVLWSESPRSLRARGLTGARLVIADHHSGRVKSVRKVMLSAACQRCRVDFLQRLRGDPQDAAEIAAATIRTIFAQRSTLAEMRGYQSPKVRTILRETKTDLNAFAGLPERHY